MPQLLIRTLECPLRLGLQLVVGSDRALRASPGGLTTAPGAVRGGCEGAVRRREQKKSSNYTELLEQQRKKFVEKAEQQVAKAALPPRCAVLQRSAQRCNIFVCCGKHVLLQQTMEEESVFVAEQKERQVTTARAVSLGVLLGVL